MTDQTIDRDSIQTGSLYLTKESVERARRTGEYRIMTVADALEGDSAPLFGSKTPYL